MVYTIVIFNTLLPQPRQTKVILKVLMPQPKKPQVTPYMIAFVYLNIYHIKLVEKEQDDMVIMTTNKNVYTNLIKTKIKTASLDYRAAFKDQTHPIQPIENSEIYGQPNIC